MNDERFPWLVLVPRLAGVTEWIELDGEQQDKLRTELNRACKALHGSDGVEKINIGALGNVVRQLHFHVIGRHDGDPAWPGPVWGSGPAHRYEPAALDQHVAYWKERLGYPAQS
ncbi:HIT domain-containing protein, partial [Escherichia coli]